MRLLLPKSLGMIVLAIYLILVGLLPFVKIGGDISLLLNLLAIAAGVLILIGR